MTEMSQLCNNQLFFLPMPDGSRAYLCCELDARHVGPHTANVRNETGDEHRMTWEATGKPRTADVITYHGGTHNNIELMRMANESETHWLGIAGYQIIGLDAYYVGIKE